MASFQNGPFIVTGASGQLGRQVIDQLIEAGAGPIIAVTRNADKLAESGTRGGCSPRRFQRARNTGSGHRGRQADPDHLHRRSGAGQTARGSFQCDHRRTRGGYRPHRLYLACQPGTRKPHHFQQGSSEHREADRAKRRQLHDPSQQPLHGSVAYERTAGDRHGGSSLPRAGDGRASTSRAPTAPAPPLPR